MGDLYRFLATGEETDGKYAKFEAEHAAPENTRPHPKVVVGVVFKQTHHGERAIILYKISFYSLLASIERREVF